MGVWVMDEWMDVWMDGCLVVLMGACVDGRLDIIVIRWMGVRMDGWLD